MSQSPAGLQIYLLTSFMLTLGQGAALRNDNFRAMVGLPPKGFAAKEEPIIAKEFIKLKQLEQEAREARGDGEVLGRGVLAHGLEASFAGTNRPSTIEGSGLAHLEAINAKAPNVTVAPPMPMGNAPFIHGISAPPEQLALQATNQNETDESTDTESQKSTGAISSSSSSTTTTTTFEEPTVIDMERANAGEMPFEIVDDPNKKQADSRPKTLSLKKFKKTQTKGKKKRKR